MKPLGRFRPEPPRRRDRASFGFLVPAAVAAIWLGLYGLFAAGIVNEQMFFVIVAVTAPITFFPMIVSAWETGLTRPERRSSEWPPIDIIVPWPLSEDREKKPRRGAVVRQWSRRTGPPNEHP